MDFKKLFFNTFVSKEESKMLELAEFYFAFCKFLITRSVDSISFSIDNY